MHANLDLCGFGVLLGRLLWKKQKAFEYSQIKRGYCVRTEDQGIARLLSLRRARGGQRRRGTVKLQWHFMANPGVEQDCLLATLQSVDEAKGAWTRCQGPF